MGGLREAVAAPRLGIATPDAVIREEVTREQVTGAGPRCGTVVAGPIERRPGRWARPERPGLGIVVDEAAISRHPFEPEVRHARGAVLGDGTVVDW